MNKSDSELDVCKICAAVVHPIGQARLLGKHDVQYFQCPNCGFVQTESPFWLEEAYSSAITSSDIGYVSRNVSLAEQTAAIISVCFPSSEPCIDFGGGYGMFVRLMRDRGYDFYRQDKYCPNLFAADFEAPADSTRKYHLLTAFEVFEHLNEPIADIESMLRLSDRILFSTEVLPSPMPALHEWNYFGLEHAQHIALFSLKTLWYIAERYGLSLCSSPDKAIHLFSRQPVSSLWWSLVFQRGSRWLIKRCARKPPSLLMSDYHRKVAQLRREAPSSSDC